MYLAPNVSPPKKGNPKNSNAQIQMYLALNISLRLKKKKSNLKNSNAQIQGGYPHHCSALIWPPTALLEPHLLFSTADKCLGVPSPVFDGRWKWEKSILARLYGLPPISPRLFSTQTRAAADLKALLLPPKLIPCRCNFLKIILSKTFKNNSF